MQSAEEEQLTELKVSVDRLEATQSQLESTVAGFATSVEQVKLDAEARANDQTIPQLIERNRLQLAADEAKTQQLLTTIIGNQNQVQCCGADHGHPSALHVPRPRRRSALPRSRHTLTPRIRVPHLRAHWRSCRVVLLTLA